MTHKQRTCPSHSWRSATQPPGLLCISQEMLCSHKHSCQYSLWRKCSPSPPPLFPPPVPMHTCRRQSFEGQSERSTCVPVSPQAVRWGGENCGWGASRHGLDSSLWGWLALDLIDVIELQLLHRQRGPIAWTARGVVLQKLGGILCESKGHVVSSQFIGTGDRMPSKLLCELPWQGRFSFSRKWGRSPSFTFPKSDEPLEPSLFFEPWFTAISELLKNNVWGVTRSRAWDTKKAKFGTSTPHSVGEAIQHKLTECLL